MRANFLEMVNNGSNKNGSNKYERNSTSNDKVQIQGTNNISQRKLKLSIIVISNITHYI